MMVERIIKFDWSDGKAINWDGVSRKKSGKEEYDAFRFAYLQIFEVP